MHPEECMRSSSSASRTMSMLAWVSHQRFKGIMRRSSSLKWARSAVGLSSQNHTSLRCHQCGNESWAMSRITSSTGRVLNPGLTAGTEQNEHANRHPRVACTTRGTKNERGRRS